MCIKAAKSLIFRDIQYSAHHNQSSFNSLPLEKLLRITLEALF